jgi:hypothetical protein
VLALAAACNIAGNVSLAEMLTSGVIDSGYMALLLYAAVAACMGILRAFLGQPELANRRLVRQHEPLVLTACTRLLMLGAALGWLLYTMDRFRVLRPLRRAGAKVLDIGIDIGEVSLHLGDVLAFAVSIWLAYWAARAVRRLLRDELPGHAGLPRGAGNSIASLSYYGVLLLGALVALSAAGFKVGQLALVFGALGVGIGFGLQNVVNNFVSGLVLMFERPIQPGDHGRGRHDGGHRARNRPACHHHPHFRRRRRGGSQRPAAERQRDQLDPVRPQQALRSRGECGLWLRPGAGAGAAGSRRARHARHREAARAVCTDDGLRRQCAELRVARLDAGHQYLGRTAQRSVRTHAGRDAGGRHRDSVQPVGRPPAERARSGMPSATPGGGMP